MGPLTPSPASECVLPLLNQRGGGRQTRLRARGWGTPNSDDWRKSLALCLLSACFSLLFSLLYCAGIFKQSMRAMNRVVIGLARQAIQPCGIGSLESILGLLKSLKIRVLILIAFPPCADGGRERGRIPHWPQLCHQVLRVPGQQTGHLVTPGAPNRALMPRGARSQSPWLFFGGLQAKKIFSE